ncbi:hypothetical protein QQF64_020134 [Cirrhinus molitorella]|uniref:Uncharacterized protein n=1 Tax=Cirrhinus molitorella TaxID=172907 RepID=A0ABR3LBR8_9TELE
MESRWARVTGRIRRAKAEQMAPATDEETGIRKAVVELERPRTEEEPEGRRKPDRAGGMEGRGVAGGPMETGRLVKPTKGWSAGAIISHGGREAHVQSFLSPLALQILWIAPRTLYGSFSAHRGSYDCSCLNSSFYIEGHWEMVFSCLRTLPLA